jgi:superfamily I DNA/RNA helicase
MKDPFKQALDHRYALERQISKVKGWKGKELFIAHAVAFPLVTIHQLALAPDAPREILIDRNDLKDVETAIERVLAFHRGAREKRKAPGKAGAEMLRDLLAPQIRIRVPMAEEFLDEEEAMVLLTREQSLALRRMARNPRMVITGCAGSGKTILAVEHARRLAADEKDVLFVCFNRRLADFLRKRERNEHLHFFTFHGLCTHLARKAGVELPDYPQGEAPPSYFEEELPDALVEAVGILGEQYDALIVDEAQDLHTDWLEDLRLTLRDEEHAPVWLFMDDNQNVYDVKLEIPKDFFLHDLTVNCRNTQAIHREVIKKYAGTVVPDVMGPTGRDLELIHTADQQTAVAGALERLCGSEEVPPQDVVVLSSHGREHSKVANDLPGRYDLIDEAGKLGDVVQFSSIRGFKGLESPVVVLCELEDLDDATIDQQLYVGFSRAKNHCVVVAPAAGD